jgi:uncharacterized protein YciI
LPFAHLFLTLTLYVLHSHESEAEQQKLFADHVRYIKGLHANKKIVMNGAYNDINGGLVILEVESRKKAEIIMAEDPALN